MSNRPGQM